MIIGIGNDLVEIKRMQDKIERWGDRFAARILTPAEYDLYRDHYAPAHFLAKQFAAKEAVAKAFGTGIGAHIGLKDIETLRNERGAPFVNLLDKGLVLAHQRQLANIFVSLSDEAGLAQALVVLESN